jgi:hypothetical protein
MMTIRAVSTATRNDAELVGESLSGNNISVNAAKIKSRQICPASSSAGYVQISASVG